MIDEAPAVVAIAVRHLLKNRYSSYWQDPGTTVNLDRRSAWHRRRVIYV